MINTVLFDMGGTLEELFHSEETKINCGKKILDYLKKHGIKLDMSPEEFMKIAGKRHKEYRDWADTNQKELMPYEIWSEWKLKGLEIDQHKLRAISEKLSYLWDITYYKRTLRPDAIQLLNALQAHGYRLGVISNTPSISQVYKTLDRYGIKKYFEEVTISSICGFKKPDRILFDVTLTDMNVLPDEAVYVGDTISLDVAGARNAGLALSFRIDSSNTESSDYDSVSKEADADYVIKNLIEILDILEGRRNKGGGITK